MAIHSPHPRLIVGAWTADRSTGRLERDGASRMLEPKVMDLLFLLASRPDRVFSREELFEALWPGVTVGDDCLARSVSKLRAALDDDARAPRYIETISKRGYRLVAPAAMRGAESAEAVPGSKQGAAWRPVIAAAGLALLLLLATELISPIGTAPIRPSPSASIEEKAQRDRAQADREAAQQRKIETEKSGK